ncbi:uncharacterized protein [Zea mays]|uniref:OSJNBb0004G23.8-like protein n=1 Tax=Zea mays TaxID=4577 RepID=A0A1D6FAI9_MAIZE|nr:uncharacterized protein LOC111590900 [Zea mays]ONM28087.1 OSJNBb0004G23.8-like protein [Zea mays]|eukprot:XP_023157569.1 uncharacterized protein LOC111590900 [Zea mays]
MAEAVGSALVQGAVSQILSNLIDGHEEERGEKSKDDTETNLERLEMAHIRLGAALETSERWRGVTADNASLLRWRRNLKRAARECDAMLHECKRRVLEDEATEREASRGRLAFPRRAARAARALVSSALGLNNLQPSRAAVRRFEWYADGAGEFLRFVELGCCAPRCRVPSAADAFVRNLAAGRKLQHVVELGDRCTFFLLWLPFFISDPPAEERGVEVVLFFIQKDGLAPQNSFYFSVTLQLSESTDVLGVAVECLDLYTPLFGSRVETVRNMLTRLPAQDLSCSWAPFLDSRQKRHWENLHSCVSQWHRPDPSCCRQHELHCGSSSNTSTPPDVSLLASVIGVHLQCQVALQDEGSLQYLTAGLLFAPHAGSSQDLRPAADDDSASSAVVVSHHSSDDEHRRAHAGVTLAQVEEVTLPMAVDYFRRYADAPVYRMLWKARHGAAYIQVAKAASGTETQSARRGGSRARSAAMRRRQEEEEPYVIPHFLSLWAAHAPSRLQGSIARWMRKEKENRLAPSQMRLEF